MLDTITHYNNLLDVYPNPFEGKQRNEGGWLVLTILWRVFR